jgi:ribosomal protein S1
LPSIGDKISVVLVKRGGDERPAILSHKKALEFLGWDVCKKAYEAKERVKGTILQQVKGGYMVEVFGVTGFMPLSLSELHTAYKHYLPVGAKIKAVIVTDTVITITTNNSPLFFLINLFVRPDISLPIHTTG